MFALSNKFDIIKTSTSGADFLCQFSPLLCAVELNRSSGRHMMRAVLLEDDMNKYDLTGKKFGRLTVLKRGKKVKHGESSKWICMCICGNEKITTRSCLVGGYTKSCGCLSKEIILARNKASATHNMSRSKIYHVWIGMKQRCYYENSRKYKYYGMRGIKVCKEWRNNFSCFNQWAISNGWNKELEIDRIDNDGGYEPSNCRVTSSYVNSRNKSTSRFWFIEGNKYNSAKEASICLKTSVSSIHRWCKGIKERGTPPKQNCYSLKKYGENNVNN